MFEFPETLIYLAGFIVIAVASNRLAKLVYKVKLPLITGLLVMGIIAGPFVLKLIPADAPKKLWFVNDFALAFIAFAAGAELYLKEIRSRIKAISWMTFGQLIVTFGLSSVAVFLIADIIPFMKGMSMQTKWAVAILTGTIFVARSPSSAIAVINELRAKGPFTQTAIGVTVVKDFLVIILFAICFSLAKTFGKGASFDLIFILILFLELMAAFALGFLLGKLLSLITSLRIQVNFKTALILFSGFSVYPLAHFIRDFSERVLGFEILLEPLLICIIASFVVINFSPDRIEFNKILNDTGTMIYVLFFTLTGVSMQLDILMEVWTVGLLLFAIRLVTLIIGALVGGTLARDPWQFNRIAWMPYITQAGVALGLSTVVAGEFPGWGEQFATIIIAVIVLNQIIGPPFFKWAISHLGEARPRAEIPEFDGIRDAIIFGLESQSLALARQLNDHGWEVKIATMESIDKHLNNADIDIRLIDGLTLETLENLDARLSEAIVLMLSDEDNYKICELIYENIGTKDIVVRLNDRTPMEKFHELGALIVEPSTAIVSLLDHYVRSPQATSLLLGLESDRDTIDLEVRNPDLHGMALRNLRFPTDVTILSVSRGGQMLISHGFTRLRIGDWVTVVGSVESLNEVTLRFDEPV